MFMAKAPEAEPPQSCAAEHPDPSSLMLAAAPPDPRTNALVIGRATLNPTIALMKSGCMAVETHSLSAPHQHLNPASLAWVADVTSEDELDAAVAQASGCLDADGAMVVDATALKPMDPVAVALKCLMKVGFRLRSVLHEGRHLILVATRRPHLAATS